MEYLVVSLGLICGWLGYRYGRSARVHPWERWPAWLFGVSAGVTGYAIATIIAFQLWLPALAGLIAGSLGGLLISSATLLTPSGFSLRQCITVTGFLSALGLLSGAFFAFSNSLLSP